jgi:hypothetical protein
VLVVEDVSPTELSETIEMLMSPSLSFSLFSSRSGVKCTTCFLLNLNKYRYYVIGPGKNREPNFFKCEAADRYSRLPPFQKDTLSLTDQSLDLLSPVYVKLEANVVT